MKEVLECLLLGVDVRVDVGLLAPSPSDSINSVAVGSSVVVALNVGVPADVEEIVVVVSAVTVSVSVGVRVCAGDADFGAGLSSSVMLLPTSMIVVPATAEAKISRRDSLVGSCTPTHANP